MNVRANVTQRRLQLALVSGFAVAAAVIGGSAMAANNATATATTTVVAPIAITKVTDLSFGSIAGAATAGTIAVNTNNSVALTGGVIVAGGTPTAAKFDITGSGTMTYAITYSTGVVLTASSGGGADMALTQVSDLTGAGGATGLVATGTLTAGAQSLWIGGTLAVGANQAAGSYTGNISATVAYN